VTVLIRTETLFYNSQLYSHALATLELIMLKQHVLFVPNFSLSSSDCSHAAAADDDDVVRMPLLVYVRNFVRMFFSFFAFTVL